MKEKHEAAVADEKPEARTPRRMTNSTTEADSDGLSSHRVSKYEKDEEGAGPEGHPRSDDEIERPLGDDDADIDHDEVEATVPGHDLDVELGRRSHDNEDLRRIGTRSSVKSKISGVLSIVGRKKARERMTFAPIPTSNLDEGIVGWESQDDPDMPLNFTQNKKWLVVGLVSAITFLTPFASSILSPGIGRLDEEFNNTSTTVGAMTVSIYLLGYVLGPLFLAPLSEIYGRRPILAAANIFFCVWQIGCALAPNIGALIVFRLFSGIGGAGCLTLGAGVIADVFRTDERGFALGIYTLGPLIGPTLGPLIGGFLSETIGWRWDFWIVLIVGVVFTGMIEIFNQETNPRVLIDRKVQRLKVELGRDDLRSCYDAEGAAKLSRRRILLNGLIRPSKMLLFSPLVLAVSIYMSFTYGVLYLLFTTIPIVFQEQYGWSVGVTGLVYLCLGLGNLAGWAVVTLTSDRGVVRRTRENNGVFQPEMRLPLCIIFACFLPPTFFWYGWAAYYQTHWIVPILGLFPFSFGIIGLFLPFMTYLVDCYPTYAASVVAANTVARSLVGALLPLAGPQMYQSLGLGWGNSLLGFISFALIPVPLVLYRYGSWLRKTENLKL